MNDESSMAIPACFFSFSSDEKPSAAAVIKSGHSVLSWVYRVEIARKARIVTVTWCKTNLLLRGLSLSIQTNNNEDDRYQNQNQNQKQHRIDLNPWFFWRNRHGHKRLFLDANTNGHGNILSKEEEEEEVIVVWDLRTAKFGGETEPRSGYYVAIISGGEVSLLVGDLKKDAYRRTGAPPSLNDPVLVSRREHLFGKNRFITRLINLGRPSSSSSPLFHEISIGFDESPEGPELEVSIDGDVALRVKRLRWKFRGNECVCVGKSGFRVEVFWDVHDWLFVASGTRHGMFIFSPVTCVSNSSSSSFYSSPSNKSSCDHQCGDQCVDGDHDSESSRFSLFVYAWKVE